MSQSAAIDLDLHEKQGVALQTEATEVLYGGAAGGGKSHLIRAVAILWCASIPGLQVYLFRRIREDLIKNHIEGPRGLRALLSPWVLAGLVVITEDEIRFWNGSKIYLCHCKDEKDRFKYLGAEIHVLLIDELTTFTDVIYRFLRNRVRAVGLNLPPEYKGMFPRILAGSNPGNVGHLWVKSTFIDSAMPLEIHRAPRSEGGMLRQFIPALLEDNPSMAKDDPGYEHRLEGLGSEALVKAMRYGDWNVVEGAYFDCWDSAKHVVRPFTIPDHWTRFRSMDWGSAKPFSIGWWAVASEDHQHESGVIPKGALVRYREWYGSSSPNVGLKLTAEQVADGIIERQGGKDKQAGIDYGVADPSMWIEDGGPSLNERMAAKDVFHAKADNKRVGRDGHMGGWDMMRARLIGDEVQGEQRPMIYTFSTCTDSIRTIPVLQHDEKRPEDLDTDSEDHAADDWRYACMSRPWTKPAPQPEPERDEWQFDTEEPDSWRTI